MNSSLIAFAIFVLCTGLVSCQVPSTTAIGSNDGINYLNVAGNPYLSTTKVIWAITLLSGNLYTITNNGQYLSSKVGGSGYNSDGAASAPNQYTMTQNSDGTWNIFNPYLQSYNGYGWLSVYNTPYGPYSPYFSTSPYPFKLTSSTPPTPTTAPTIAPTIAPTAAPTQAPPAVSPATSPTGCRPWNGAPLPDLAKLQFYAPSYVSKGIPWVTYGPVQGGTKPTGLYLSNAPSVKTFTWKGVTTSTYPNGNGQKGMLYDDLDRFYSQSWGGEYLIVGGNSYAVNMMRTAAAPPEMQLSVSQLNYPNYGRYFGPDPTPLNGQYLLDYDQTVPMWLYVC